MNQKFQFCKRRMTRGLGVHRKSSCRPAGPSAGRLVTLLAIFGISFASHAQSPQVRAQFLYTAAIEDMNAKRFDACVQKLGEARQLLGRIVAKIQAPLTRCHYGRGAWDDTAAAARAYFEVQSDTALVEY